MSKKIIHIGFPKTGSTYLQQYFYIHPEIYHNRDRFNYYVKTGIIDQKLLETDENYSFDVLSEELLSIWPGNDSNLDFSKHNMNYDIKEKQKEVAENLNKLFPNAKILIVVREYKTLLTSLYSQYLFGGGIHSFKRILRTHQHLTLEMYNYDYVISLYKKLFGEENVLVLPYEFLAENPSAYILYLESVLGWKNIEFPSQRVHSSLNNITVPIIRILNLFAIFYLKIFLPQNKRKEKFLNYLEWLNDFKERLNQKFRCGKKIKIPNDKIRLEDFLMQSQTVRFKGELERFNKYYELRL